MSNSALVHILDRWAGSPVSDLDSSLLRRFLTERDEEAFAMLVRRHGPLVYGTCQRILGNWAEADDAFQAAFFILARRAHTLKLDRSIGPWLHGVAVRVAKKLRGQIVQRRLREMSAAKSERVAPTETQHDFWAIIDDELGRIALPLREALLLCDLGGQSHAQAAAALGLAKGTITKRLGKAHEQLATRLRRRGITLGVGAVSSLIATESSASVPAALLSETARQAVAFSSGQVGGSLTAKTLAEGVMRSLKVGVLKTYSLAVFCTLTIAIVGGSLIFAGDPVEPKAKRGAQPKAVGQLEVAKLGTMWKETFTAEYESSLPVSLAFSGDGKTLLSGDTNGDVMATKLPSDPPTYRWKTSVGGAHAAVAYSTDQEYVYAATRDGVRILDPATGKEVARIDQPNSNPIALGVFPIRAVAKFSQFQVVFGNAHGYFVKTWADSGEPADTMSTITTSTVAKGVKPADLAAVPLAVDPRGRSAIMTGPRDARGEVGGVKGKNILWAYVCGDYEKGSPGNRVLVGHTATVVSAAWSKEGSTAVTGDADGRVIVWEAKTMKEARRVELAGRILALAISDDGTHISACVRGKQGAEVYVWETAKPANALKPIHNQQGDFSAEPYASLTFSSDGKRLAGCAIDKKWLQVAPKTPVSGQVHLWELTPEPKGQVPPKEIYTKPLPTGGSPSFVVLDNFTILTAATKEGAIDFRDLRDGGIQARIVLGKFTIGRMKLSSDHKWLALEQHALIDPKLNTPPSNTFDVGLWEMKSHTLHTLPSCEAILAIASGGKVVAVIRDKKIELWEIATEKLLKTAPFKHTRIDAAQFSPDGKLLAISDHNELVLWRWEEDKHERIDLGRAVGALTFSPDGKLLAEGPTPGDAVRIRDVETRKVVQTLANSAKQSMNVPRMAYTQGGRVLIACDNMAASKDVAVPGRINLWDTATGSLAHKIAIPAGLPANIDVSPNGRYLAAMLDDGKAGMKLRVWRLDGEKPVKETGPTPPATGLRP